MKPHKKHLNDDDISKMAEIGYAATASNAAVRREVVGKLNIRRIKESTGIGNINTQIDTSPEFYYENGILTLDLHGHTEEESWNLILELFSRAKAGRQSRARVIYRRIGNPAAEIRRLDYPRHLGR